MATHWEDRLLSNVVRFGNGKAIKPGGTGVYPVFGSNGIIGGSDEFLHENGVVIGRVGAYCGAVVYCPTKFWASDNTLVAYPSSDQVDTQFLYHLLVDELDAQLRIAGILSAYDELIENCQHRIKILESMARALYREWFVYFRFPGHESVPLVPSVLGEIPHDWATTTVGEVADLVSRGPSLAYVDSGGVQVVNQRCVRDEGIEMQAVQFAARLPEKKSHLYLQPRDILINSMGVGTLGRVSRNLSIDELTIIHNCITVVRSKASELTQLFLYYRLSECQEQFENLGIGATGQTSLRIETIEDVQVALPSATLLEAFENLVSPMWTQVRILKHQIENLRATRDALLPRLLSGQIDVDTIDA
jgi:type I restriction enzyme S subunit